MIKSPQVKMMLTKLERRTKTRMLTQLTKLKWRKRSHQRQSLLLALLRMK